MPEEEGISGKARATGTLATLTLKTVNSPCHIKAPVQAYTGRKELWEGSMTS